MMRIRCAARLHFGLIDPLPAEGQRRFGGAGMMAAGPELAVRAEPAADWSAEGPLAERALAFARRCAEGMARSYDVRPAPHRLVVETAPPAHAGLGTGTQLGLAVARLLARAGGLDSLRPAELARLAGRGQRSALGVYGSFRGGFLVEAGQGQAGRLGPLVAAHAVPEDWHLVLAMPAGQPAWHGPREHDAFARLAPAPAAALCRLVLMGMLPALAEGDLAAFGEAVHEYNARAGEAFAPVQGGPYVSPLVAELVAFVRGQGVKGAGQSSWGPTVFALAADADQATALAGAVAGKFGLSLEQLCVTRPWNHGARLVRDAG